MEGPKRALGKLSYASAIGRNFEDVEIYLDRLNAGLTSDDRPKCLCHGDFHPGNLLNFGGKVWAVDWLNAHWGDPYCDLGRFATLSGMSPGSAGNILREYQGCYSSQDVRHLQRCIALFDIDYWLFSSGRDELSSYVSFFSERVRVSQRLVEPDLPEA